MSWFWTSSLVGWLENKLVNLTNYMWKKRREEEKKIVKKIKENT